MPFSVISSGNPANTGTLSTVNRPNIVGDPYAGNRTVDQDFNTAAFVHNAQYTIGNAGRNILRQRGFFNCDFWANKEFAIQERLRLQFRFESFHFTNTPRFGAPGATLSTATFGKITSADTPRKPATRSQTGLVVSRAGRSVHGKGKFSEIDNAP